eukprot:TRINITY_DN68895_c1_g1_i4.p1 TRINITY_DN68895_c1_g1~~TRINITY_DN68895_c1_g1_i4.p1  ORF type:complete len:264 (-),score=33.04 TRINITY_DN68895_c1_g1_i4:58-765(-)
MEGPKKHTTTPYVTGTSVVAIKFKDGVVMGADTLGSYGSLARFRHLERIKKVNDRTLIGGGGEYSDFEAILGILKDLTTKDFEYDDGDKKGAREIHSYLTRVMYERRNKMDPLWNQIVVAGHEEGKPFLGLADLYGSCYEDTTIATGYGAYIAIPLLRKAYRDDLTEEEAKKIVEDSLRVLYYRDARALNKIQIGVITATKVEISDPKILDTHWTHLEPASRKHQILETAFADLP